MNNYCKEILFHFWIRFNRSMSICFSRSSSLAVMLASCRIIPGRSLRKIALPLGKTCNACLRRSSVDLLRQSQLRFSSLSITAMVDARSMDMALPSLVWEIPGLTSTRSSIASCAGVVRVARPIRELKSR